MAQEDVFKKLVSHCKEYGFVFPSSEIYDGLGAVYDYGQMGVELKNNIKQYWWQSMVLLHENIVGIDSAIFMHPTIWKASGHVDAFNDPLIDNRDSKKRYRADVLIEDQLAKYDDKINKEVAKAAKRFGEAFDEAQFRSTNGRVLEHQAKRDALHERFSKALNDNNLDELRQIILDEEIVCPISGTKNWTEVRQFNLMFDSRSQTINKHTFIQFNSDCKIKGLCYFHGFLKIIFRNKVLSYHSAIPQNTVGILQCNNSVIRNISYFMKVACRSTGSNDYSNSTVMNLPKGINRGWQHFMSFKTYQCSIHIEHDRFYHNTYIFIHSSTI